MIWNYEPTQGQGVSGVEEGRARQDDEVTLVDNESARHMPVVD